MTKPIKNVAASVRQRLLNQARAENRPFAELLQYYALERFLYRLSESTHKDKFTLKGAFMLRAWNVTQTRPTRDIDVLGHLPTDSLVEAITNVCNQSVEPDGLRFDPTTISTENITEGADYKGLRIRLRGYLDKSQIPIQIDVGFGDAAATEELTNYPTLLGFPAPQLRGYARESTIAEKFEAMTKLGLLNSRMKDFYDIWLLSQQFSFEGEVLARAIRKTFENRDTELQAKSLALTKEFATDKSKIIQWKAFLRKNRLEDTPIEFHEIVKSIAEFLEPVIENLVSDGNFQGLWQPNNGWDIN